MNAAQILGVGGAMESDIDAEDMNSPEQMAARKGVKLGKKKKKILPGGQ